MDAGKVGQERRQVAGLGDLRLRFERFLRFAGTVSLPADLTERHFRALWAQTDKNTREEELRFRQVVKLLCPEHVASPPIAVDPHSSTRHARRRSARRPVARARDVPRHRSAPRREPDVAEAPMATSPIQRKIPKDGRRSARVIREDDDDAANDHLDGRPSLAARDRLLQRLITVHNEPRFDLFTHN